MRTIPETRSVGACDVCGSRSSSPAGSYVLQVAEHPLSGSRWYLRRCTSCGLVYVDPRPAQQLFGGFEADEERDMNSPLWPERLRIMSRFCRAGRLLDVGTGAGAFLHHARAAGWDAVGLEIQEEFARAARSSLNVPVLVGEIGDAEIQSQRFDAVTMWDVIEHVGSVRSTLASAACIVQPGGLLAISTINAASLSARLFGSRWIFWNRPGRLPEHLQGFTVDSLARALRQAGFEPVSSRTHFAAGALIEPLDHLLSPQRRLGPRWSDFRRSIVGRAGAFALWNTVGLLGRPLDVWKLGDLLEMYAVRRDPS